MELHAQVPMRILLVDDDRLFMAFMVRSLRLARPAWNLRTAEDGAKALQVLKNEPVDILVTDIAMPVMGGLDLLAEIRRDPVLAGLPLIFITSHEDRATMRKGMVSGADDYLTKPVAVEELVLAIESRLQRLGQVAGTAEGAAVLGEPIRELLTDRELEVLGLIGRGKVTKDIAQILGLSPRTVCVHRANIMRKLDLHNAAALAALAIRARVS
jgi:DNA-binding NarL/FixJ family response regulator